MEKNAFVYASNLEGYSFGKGHPFGGERFIDFFNFLQGRLPKFGEVFELRLAEPAGDELLSLVHTKEYINFLRLASGGINLKETLRYVSIDNLNPETGTVPCGIEEASRIIVGIAIKAGGLLVEGKFKKALGFGGMHHAKPNYGEGFCFYNDIAILVKYLKKEGFKRILVLDTDAHAGNGVAEIFYDDPEVLFIDLHQDPHTLYPGCGFLEEIGINRGAGFNVNCCLSPGTGDDAYAYIFDEVVFPLAEEFKPQVVVRYGGADPHYLDRLTELGLTLAGFELIGRRTKELVERFTQGELVDLLLSGYNPSVLCYAWLALWKGLLDLEVDLGDFKEENRPSPDSGLGETKGMVKGLKGILKKYWACFG